jgi:putative transposase
MSQLKGIKTLEFKLSLSASQAATVDAWLDVQRWVWNHGLALLKEFEAFSHYNKHDKAYAPCCSVPWEYRWVKGDDEEWIAIPYSPVRAYKKAGLSCPMSQPYREPRLDRDSEYSLIPLFAHKLNREKPWFTACPYKLTQGTIKLLATSWQEYRKGKRKAPRFKHRGDNRTLNDTQSGNAKVDGGYVTLPKLGRLRVRSLEDRWPADALAKSYRIMKEPSGYYLLLVGELPQEAAKPSKRIAAFDAGVVHVLNDDAGHHIDIPGPLKRRLKKIKRLSRKAARQQKGSKNQAKTYAALAKTHEKVRRDRKAWHHKLSIFAVRKYAGIAVEDLKLANMVRRSKAKPKADGSGYDRNMAKAKAGLNRAILDAGIGGLFRMIEAKAKVFGREFVRVNPAYTSQTCNACGVIDAASRRSQSEFVCTSCGHTENADTNAARNIRVIAFPDLRGSYPASAGDVKPGELASAPTMNQEGAQAPPQGDALATSQSKRDTQGVDGPNPHASNPKIRRKSRSAQPVAEMPLQLSFWDAAPETG